MIDRSWWERWPERLAYELAALDAAGIRWQRDDDAAARGILRLHLTIPAVEGELFTTVVFPDDYPYFRFQLYAPTLDLPYHQNPFERNLCLIGRRTHFWDTTDTVAGLIQRQLPAVIATAQSRDGIAAEGTEQKQAEPFSDYYPYAPSMILVQTDWSIPTQYQTGHLLIGTGFQPPLRPAKLLRGAVLEVRSEDGALLCAADDSLRIAFPGRTVDGRWARSPAAIRHSNPIDFLTDLCRQHPVVGDARPNHIQDDRWLRVWGVLFPEEVAHRQIGEGWLFVSTCDRKRPQVSGPRRPHFAAQMSRREMKNHRGH